MATTIGMYSKTNPVEESALRRVRRSRFSFHFMTQRTRRWLLVQWVSMPVAADNDEQVSAHPRFSPESKRPTYHSVLNDYTTQAWLRRSA
jgi:hypothetical protein